MTSDGGLSHLQLCVCLEPALWGQKGGSHICAFCACLPSFPPISRCPRSQEQPFGAWAIAQIPSLGIQLLRNERTCQLILLLEASGSQSHHLLQTKALVSPTELERSGQKQQIRCTPFTLMCPPSQIPGLHHFIFHFVWINFALLPNSSFLSGFQST